MTFHICPQNIAIEKRLRAFTRIPVYFSAGGLTQSGSDFPAERQLMARASEKRQREFYSGRHQARLAMHRAGTPPSAVLRGELGNPLWPANVVGSITHDHSLAAAMVCPANGVRGVGLDLIEDPDQVTDNLAEQIMSPNEAALLQTLYPDLPAAGVAFSIKESVVKAVSLFMGRYVDLLEIRLSRPGDTLLAEVDGLPDVLPCAVFPTEIGLITSCIYISKPGSRPR